MKRVAIIGAGISGLSCAFRLQELKEKHSLNLDVSVFEAGPRTGGNVQTDTRDGFLLEKGPDSFITERPAVIDLCKRLGIEGQILPTNQQHRKVFVIKNGKLISLPEGFYLIAPTNIGSFMRTSLFSAAGKIRMAAEMFVPPASADTDESVASFVRRRFGREALERVGQPMIAGIYSGDPEKLGVKAVLPQFKEMERKHGSVIRGLVKKMRGTKDVVSGPRYGLFLSFQKGMATLTDSLVARLPAGAVHLDSRVSIRKIYSSDQWIVIEPNGSSQKFDAVCISTGAKNAAEMLKGIDLPLSHRLGKIRFESVATLNLAYKRDQVGHSLDGFGLVSPAVEGRSLMACTFSSQKFEGRAKPGHILLRAFIGGAFGKKYYEMDPEELTAVATQDLAGLLNISGSPCFHSLARYPDSLPQYDVDHHSLISEIERFLSSHSGLYLTGSSYRGTGIAHAVDDGQKQAERIVDSFVKISNSIEPFLA